MLKQVMGDKIYSDQGFARPTPHNASTTFVHPKELMKTPETDPRIVPDSIVKDEFCPAEQPAEESEPVSDGEEHKFIGFRDCVTLRGSSARISHTPAGLTNENLTYSSEASPISLFANTTNPVISREFRSIEREVPVDAGSEEDQALFHLYTPSTLSAVSEYTCMGLVQSVQARLDFTTRSVRRKGKASLRTINSARSCTYWKAYDAFQKRIGSLSYWDKVRAREEWKEKQNSDKEKEKLVNEEARVHFVQNGGIDDDETGVIRSVL